MESQKQRRVQRGSSRASEEVGQTQDGSSRLWGELLGTTGRGKQIGGKIVHVGWLFRVVASPPLHGGKGVETGSRGLVGSLALYAIKHPKHSHSS